MKTQGQHEDDIFQVYRAMWQALYIRYGSAAQDYYDELTQHVDLGSIVSAAGFGPDYRYAIVTVDSEAVGYIVSPPDDPAYFHSFDG